MRTFQFYKQASYVPYALWFATLFFLAPPAYAGCSSKDPLLAAPFANHTDKQLCETKPRVEFGYGNGSTTNASELPWAARPFVNSTIYPPEGIHFLGFRYYDRSVTWGGFIVFKKESLFQIRDAPPPPPVRKVGGSAYVAQITWHF